LEKCVLESLAQQSGTEFRGFALFFVIEVLDIFAGQLAVISESHHFASSWRGLRVRSFAISLHSR
jgi:hypothetical protein